VRDVEEAAGVAIDLGLRIHRDLGPGMLESVYESILAAQLIRSGMVVERQKAIPIEYDGIVFQEGFRADLVVEGKLISRSSPWIRSRLCMGASSSPICEWRGSP
jgi:GxxExxY protein